MDTEDKIRIIFLDIDGVMNSDEYFMSHLDRDGDTLFIDPEKLTVLNMLKDIPGIQIVISSSWGDTADGPLKRLGLEIPITGHIHHFHFDWICRGCEIEDYIVNMLHLRGTKFGEKHRDHDKYEYVIFDDDEDMLLGQKDNFIQTNRDTGLTEDDIRKAKEILMK